MNISSVQVKTLYRIEITKDDIRKILEKAQKDESEENLYERIFDFLRADTGRMPEAITEEVVQRTLMKIACNNFSTANYVSKYFGMNCEDIGYLRTSDQVWVMETSMPGDRINEEGRERNE